MNDFAAQLVCLDTEALAFITGGVEYLDSVDSVDGGGGGEEGYWEESPTGEKTYRVRLASGTGASFYGNRSGYP